MAIPRCPAEAHDENFGRYVCDSFRRTCQGYHELPRSYLLDVVEPWVVWFDWCTYRRGATPICALRLGSQWLQNRRRER